MLPKCFGQTEFHDGRCGSRRSGSVRGPSRRSAVRYGGGVIVLEYEAWLDDLLRLYARHLHCRPLQLIDDSVRRARNLRPLQDRQIRDLQGGQTRPTPSHDTYVNLDISVTLPACFLNEIYTVLGWIKLNMYSFSIIILC